MRMIDRHSPLEAKILKWTLLIGSVFWFTGMVKGLIWNGSLEVIILDYLSFLVSGLCLLAYQRGTRTEKISFIFCLLWIPLFLGYWHYMGGIDGPFSYTLLVLFTLMVALLSMRQRMIAIPLLLVPSIVMLTINEHQSLVPEMFQQTGMSTLAVDYILNTLVIVVITFIMKRHFDKERYEKEKKNEVLRDYNEELEEKQERLLRQKEILSQLKSNLEVLVKDRTQEQEMTNHQLQEYAYDNAHVIRGPLTSILSLVDLMKNSGNGDVAWKADLEHIEKNALNLDKVVRKINQTLH